MKHWILAAGLAAAAVTPAIAQTSAAKADEKGTLNLLFENDLFFKTDRDYTNGVEFSYTAPSQDTPEFLERMTHALPFFSSTGKVRVTYTAGQSIYTPTATGLVVPPPTQRPYAGFLYGAIGLTNDTGTRLDQVNLQAGVTGPSSLASDTQNFVHRVIGTTEAKGWRSQLRGEPAIILTYSRTLRLVVRQPVLGLGFDFQPHYGAAVGNVYDYVNAGAMARLGFNIPDDYGPLRIEPSLPGSGFFEATGIVGAYLFGGVDGRAIGRNMFLDGNTWAPGPRVSKFNFVADLEFGATVTFKAMQITFTHVFRTKEYKTQTAPDNFGAVNVSFKL